MDGEELGFGENVGVGGDRGWSTCCGLSRHCTEWAGARCQLQGEVKQVLELLSRLHCGTIPSLSTKPLNAQT